MSVTHESHPTSVNTKSVLLVDDHPGFRHGIGAVISITPGLTVCGEASNAATALDLMRSTNPDLALIDICLPGVDGMELIKLMKAERPDLKILVLSMHDESIYALRALKAGAAGYIMKADAIQNVSRGIQKILAGGMHVSAKLAERLVFRAIQAEDQGKGSPVDRLSERETEVFELLGQGFVTKQIAAQLNLSVKTIETHRAHLKEKLGCDTAATLVQFAKDWISTERKPVEIAQEA